jgi:UbiA prenyltransferase family
LRAYLQLVRAPNLFTAATNVVAGFTLMTAVDDAQFDRPQWGHLIVLLFISVALYASGAIFNDCLDIEHDRRFRPDRPIPSGAVSLGRAYLLGLLLAAAALGAAMLLTPTTVLITGLLVTSIWLYNGVLKRIKFVGALSMGLCRALNMILGMSTGASMVAFTAPDRRELVWAPLLLGLYTAIVTAASHYEDRPAGGAGRWVLFGAAAGLPVVLVGVAIAVVKESWISWVLLIILILATAGLFIFTLTKVSFKAVRRAIGISIMLIIVFDAAICLGVRNAPLWLGALVLLALLPTWLTSRVASGS